MLRKWPESQVFQMLVTESTRMRGCSLVYKIQVEILRAIIRKIRENKFQIHDTLTHWDRNEYEERDIYVLLSTSTLEDLLQVIFSL